MSIDASDRACRRRYRPAPAPAESAAPAEAPYALAIAFCDETEGKLLHAIERVINFKITVSKTPELKKMWSDELSQINVKIKGIRTKLCAAFRQHSGDNYFDYILSQEGMFAMLPATEEQMEQLRVEYAVYGLNNGRINIASIHEKHIDYLVESVLSVTRINK